MRYIASIVLRSEISKHNLWTQSAVSSRKEKTLRGDKFRENFIIHTGGFAEVLVADKGDAYYCKCMLSGQLGLGRQVKVAHLLPAVSKISTLTELGFEEADVDDVRNGLLLCSGFKDAFDTLRASFVKGIYQDTLGGLREGYIFTIWDDECRKLETFPESGLLIEEFEGHALTLNGHDPFKRALSFQAYQAFLHNKVALHLRPKDFGSPVISSKSDLAKMRRDLMGYKLAVEKDIDNEYEEN